MTKAKILLIDEIENGLHHSVIEAVWRGIGALSRNHDIQVFVTTHSEECVNAASTSSHSRERSRLPASNALKRSTAM